MLIVRTMQCCDQVCGSISRVSPDRAVAHLVSFDLARPRLSPIWWIGRKVCEARSGPKVV